MECGDYDIAETLKVILENRQRFRRKNNSDLKPRWFSKAEPSQRTTSKDSYDFDQNSSSSSIIHFHKPTWLLTKNYFEQKKQGFHKDPESAFYSEALYDFSDGLLSPKSSAAHIDTDAIRSKAVYKSSSRISGNSNVTHIGEEGVEKIRNVIEEYNSRVVV